MPKFLVVVGRTVEIYATLEVEAADEAEARKLAEKADQDDEAEYSVDWDTSGDFRICEMRTLQEAAANV
jgi:hypothetical protein